MVLNSDLLSYPGKQILLHLASLHYLRLLACLPSSLPGGLVGISGRGFPMLILFLIIFIFSNKAKHTHILHCILSELNML